MRLFRKQTWFLPKKPYRVKIYTPATMFSVTVQARGVIGAKLKALDILARELLSENISYSDELKITVERV